MQTIKPFIHFFINLFYPLLYPFIIAMAPHQEQKRMANGQQWPSGRTHEKWNNNPHYTQTVTNGRAYATDVDSENKS